MSGGNLDVANFWLEILTIIITSVYYYLTYLLAKDIYEPVASFELKRYFNSSILNFQVRNNSKVEIEVYSKIFVKSNDLVFQAKSGFYGNKTSLVVQPFNDRRGNVDLRDLIGGEDIKFGRLLDEGKIKEAQIKFQIRYKKIGSGGWKNSSVFKYFIDFEKNRFWLLD